MLIEITDKTVEAYQLTRLNEGAAGKTINEEVGELLRVMGDVGDAIRLKLRKSKRLKLPQRNDCGRALSPEEEQRILEQARKARSPVIYPAIVADFNNVLLRFASFCIFQTANKRQHFHVVLR
jgi:hypothetical protein